MKKRIICLIMCVCFMAVMALPAFAAEKYILTESEASIRASAILKDMTIEEKIAQMLIIEFRQWTDGSGTTKYVTAINDDIANAISKYGIGGVILFSENAKSTASTAALICDMQNAALSSETGLPLFISVDQEGGTIVRLGTGTSTCGNMALGATGKPKLAYEAASIIGSELYAEGFNVDFAPDMDVNNNPSNPVIGLRSFSDDPETVGKFGYEFINGLHSENVAAALKHFPGHGDTSTDSHSGLPNINKTLDELKKCELVPFAAGIEAGADIVMTAHIQYPQIEKETYISKYDGKKITLPATLSKTIITDILRGEMGYKGVVCTDAMNMSAIAQHFNKMDAARLAINAGVDILLMPVTVTSKSGVDALDKYIDGIADMVKNGSVKEETVNAAVKRILELKIERGLLDREYDKSVQVRTALSVVGSKEHHEKEREIAEKAITLVKNDNELLPISLKSGDKAVLFCSYNNEVNSMKYAVSSLKEEGDISQGAECEVLSYQNLSELTEVQKKAVLSADTVIASVETYKTANITGGWQASFLDELIAFAHENGKKVTIISIQLPYDLARYQKADALLAAYSSQGMNTIPTEFNGETATYGPNLPAAVTAVFGGIVPTGKLPVDIPKLDKNYNYTDEILYPRGFSIGPAVPFRDIKETDWSYPDILYVYENDLMNGTSDVLFSPKKTTTRGMIVTILYRMEGEPAFRNDNIFTDMKAGSYYEKAVVWASGKGIVTGYEDSTFHPDKPVTREELAAILYRYVQYKGEGFTGDFMFLLDYTDAGSVSAYADEAMRWCVMEGIINGTEGKLLPKGSATREQTAAMLHRFCTVKSDTH